VSEARIKIYTFGDLKGMKKYLGPFIFVMLGVFGAVYGLFAAARMELPNRFVFFFKVVLFVSVAYWLKEDSKKANLTPVQDMNFFLLLLWPIVLPYHLWKTRRRTGLLIILGAVAVTVITPLLVYLALSGLAHKQ
jgi:hypothetical protein